MNSKHLVGMLLLLLACACSVATVTAQTPPTQTLAQQQPKNSKELEQKALVMLDEIIKDAQSFRLPENRLRLKAVAATLLWKHDEARARIYFKETMTGIADLLNSQDEDGASQPHIFPGVKQLRREVVQMLASRDPRMAREFLRATRPPGQPQQVAYERYGDLFNDLQLEYGLATKIVETDPKQALELAEENLSKGFSYELINTLSTLKAKDREAAGKLASAMLAKLRSENLSSNGDAANIAFSLLNIVFDSSTEDDTKQTKKENPLLDAQGMRELLEMNITLALNSPSHPGRLETIAGLLPQVQKYAPARMAELRRKLAQSKTTVAAASNDDEDDDGAPMFDMEVMPDTIQKGTAEEMLAAAEKAPQNMSAHLYQAAAMKFAEKGDVERAREIINTKVADPDLRRYFLSLVDQKASLSAAEQGKMEQVRKSLANLRTNEERAMMLAQIATTLMAKGDKKIAHQLLEEAQGMVSYRAKNITQLGAQLTVVQAYAKLSPERSLTMLEPIVDQLNELLAAAVTLGGFILDQEVMRDDEIRMEVFASVLPFATQYFMPDLRSLATSDFERTRSLAERFQRDEIRMMARLLVVQSVLGELTPPVNIEQMTNTTRTTTTTSTTTITVPDEQPVKNDDDGTP